MSREACTSAAACPPLREQLLLPTASTQAVRCQFWSPGEQEKALKLSLGSLPSFNCVYSHLSPALN